MDFQWIPGKGADPQAIERMKQHFPKPSEPSYDIYPGGLRYFTDLMDKPLSEIPSRDLVMYLFNTGSMNFGYQERWVEWYRYLLPYLLERVHDDDMLSSAITNFIAYYTEEIVEEYPGFRDDVLKTLGQCLMTATIWDGPDLWPEDDARWGYNYVVWHEEDWLSPMNASMFFCLKYLTPAEIPSWVASMAAIEGKVWQGELVKWLKGVKLFFDYVAHPEKLPEPDEFDKPDAPKLNYPLECAGIDWAPSHCLFNSLYSSLNLSDYLPDENIATFWREIDKYPHLSTNE